MPSSRRRAEPAPYVPHWTLDDVTYDPDTHTSSLPDGTDVPHVTTVLGAVRVTTDFQALERVSPRVARDVEWGRLRGEAVHKDCHALDDGELDWDRVHADVMPFLRCWQRCTSEKGLVPVSRERRLFHPLHLYTGIGDGVFQSGPRRVLIDTKTGDPESSAAHLQTAAYEAAWNFACPPSDRVDERWVVWLTPERARRPYVVFNYTARPDAHLDFGKFLACLTVYREQPGRRRRITA
jgi:hypothetical protein